MLAASQWRPHPLPIPRGNEPEIGFAFLDYAGAILISEENHLTPQIAT